MCIPNEWPKKKAYREVPTFLFLRNEFLFYIGTMPFLVFVGTTASSANPFDM